MKLLLKRTAKKQSYTIGDLYINGEWFSNTLEDTDRGLNYAMPEEKIKKLKVYGKTAIPSGSYRIDMSTVSPKFKNYSWAKPYNGKIPRLLNVPGFEGVLIHPGNQEQDTLGCILVGRNTIKGMVTSSQATFKSLMETLLKSNEEVTITIE